jgi:predicted aspartyl protease
VQVDRSTRFVLGGFIILVIIARLFVNQQFRRNNTFRMHLVSPDLINESLVLEANLAGKDSLFLIDTGYAGPPVISTSYLALSDPVDMSLEKRYVHITRALMHSVNSNQHHRAIDTFLRSKRCTSYTSGCTMRLMGIGAVSEQQADMMLCQALQFRAYDGYMSTPISSIDADVFVTNRLSQSIHILTCDYLVHCSPTLLDLKNGLMRLYVPFDEAVLIRTGMTMLPHKLNGGAFVVPIMLGGIEFHVTVDTGAPGPVSLGRDSAERLRRCVRKHKTLGQEGVNGERVCSEIITTDMMFCNKSVQNVPVFINDTPVEGVDGYIGMGVLRAYNMLITEEGIGFASNGVAIRSVGTFTDSAESGKCDIALSC